MNSFHLILSCWDKIIFKGDVSYLELTTPLGRMGIKKGHEPLLALLKEEGTLMVQALDGKETSFPYISGMVKLSNDDCQISISMN